jgi:hypothetical protein
MLASLLLTISTLRYLSHLGLLKLFKLRFKIVNLIERESSKSYLKSSVPYAYSIVDREISSLPPPSPHTILIELRIKTRVADISSRSGGIIFTIKQTGPSMELRG